MDRAGAERAELLAKGRTRLKENGLPPGYSWVRLLSSSSGKHRLFTLAHQEHAS